MDEKIQDNSIFETELSEHYKEELMTDIPDIWDKISMRLDSVSVPSSSNDTITDGTTNIPAGISSEYIPDQTSTPVIRYNKAAAKSSHSYFSGSALTRFIPVAAAVVLLCICVPVFIRLQHNGQTESAVTTADYAPEYKETSEYTVSDTQNSTYGFSAESKNADYAEEACAEEAYDGDDTDRCESTEGIAAESNAYQSETYIKIYVVPDTDYSKISELISKYDMELESDSSDPTVYHLFPNSSMNEKELSKLCDELRKYDFIVQATLAAQ